MRTLVSYIAAAALLVSSAAAQEGLRSYIVRMKADASSSVTLPRATVTMTALTESMRGTIGAETSRIKLATRRSSSTARAQRITRSLEEKRARHKGYELLWLMDGVRVTCSRDLAEELKGHEDVASVELDPFLSVTLPAPKPALTAGSAGSWQLETIRVNSMHEKLGLTGKGVTVGVIDTGIVDGGPLAGRIAAYRDFTSNPSATPSDPQGHGTAVASVLAGSADGQGSGVAPECKLVVARVLEEMELPETHGARRKVVGAFASRIVQAMQWMLDPDGNPATEDAPRIINNSWGFSDPKLLPENFFRPAIDAWSQANVLAVFSAGNKVDEQTGFTFYPASYPQVLAVGSISIDRSLSGFSAVGHPARNAKPDLVAPGASVFGWNARDGYGPFDGTSFAAPQVSGIAALLLEASPGLSRQDLFDLLTGSALDLGQAGRDLAYGAGLAQGEDAARRLMALLESRLLSSPSPEAFLASLEKLLAQGDTPFVVELAESVTDRFLLALAPADRDRLAAISGSQGARSFALARARELKAAGRLAAR